VSTTKSEEESNKVATDIMQKVEGVDKSESPGGMLNSERFSTPSGSSFAVKRWLREPLLYFLMLVP